MPEMIGKVRCVRVNETAGFLTIEDEGTGEMEVFILWLLPGSSIPSSLTSFTRIVHSMWLSLIRQARDDDLTVTVVHPDNSAEVVALQLN